MARTSVFGPRRTFIKTSGNKLSEDNFFTPGGLNLYSPDELMSDSDSPYGRNFRIFKQDTLESRVSISTRQGTAAYSVPLGETDRGNEITATDGNQTVNLITQFAQPFTVSAAGRLTKIKLQLKNDNSGTGPLIVQIYTNVSSAPGALLATSSILSSGMTSTYGYKEFNFIEAPVVALSTTYWIVVSQQSEGTGDYKVSSTTNATTALKSVDSGNTWAATTYALNYYIYVSTNSDVKGIHRYYRTTTTPVTLFVSNTVLYSVNDTTGATTSIGTGFSASATNYRFLTLEDVCYIVNGVDVPKTWNGTTFASAGGSPPVAVDICTYKQKLFLLGTNNAIYWTIDDASSYTTYPSDNIQYIPSPKPSDVCHSFHTYQDMLVCFSKNSKWLITGYRRDNMQVRECPANMGSVGIYASCKYGNYLYFVSSDSMVYAYNGGTDSPIGLKVTRELEGSADISKTQLIAHGDHLRLYYIPSGQSTTQNCLVYDIGYKQWAMDTGIYTGRAKAFNSQTDTSVLVHGSSLVGALYYGESSTSTSDLGSPILFDYWTKYFSYKHPSKKHRLKRLYPFFRSGIGPYYVDVQTDTNNRNKPESNLVYLGANGATWGTGTWGSGLKWGGDAIQPNRISVSGQARSHQVRLVQHGVDNPVDFLGIATYIKMRRPI